MQLTPDATVSPSALVAGQHALVMDAAWASLTGALSGGVLIVAFALSLGAGPMQIGVLAAIPLVAQAAQLPAIALVDHLRRRKMIVVVSLAVARVAIMGLALLALVPGDGVKFGVLAVMQFLIASLGAASACAMNSWLHQLLPRDHLGRFFSKRLLVATVSAGLGTLAIGWLVDHPPEGNSSYAYALAFAAAGLAGFVSVSYLARCPEPTMGVVSLTRGVASSLKEPLRDGQFRRVLVLLATWNVASAMAAPFLTVYLIRQLGYGLGAVTLLWLTSQLANACMLYFWGRLSDRLSNKAILAVAMPTYFASTLGLAFTGAGSPSVQLLLLHVLHLLMGAAAGGIGLATGNLGLKFAPQGQGTGYLAAAGLVAALAGGITPIAAGTVAEWLESRQLEIMVRWISPAGARDVSLMTFAHWEFLFGLSAMTGLLVMHALSRLSEGKEVSERQVMQELGLEALRTVAHLSSIGGMLGSIFHFGREISSAPQSRSSTGSPRQEQSG